MMMMSSLDDSNNNDGYSSGMISRVADAANAVATSVTKKKPPQALDLEQRLMMRRSLSNGDDRITSQGAFIQSKDDNNETTTNDYRNDNNNEGYSDEYENVTMSAVDEVANMAFLKQRSKRRLPMICRIGYLLLINFVVISFISAASKKLFPPYNKIENYIRTLSDPSTFVINEEDNIDIDDNNKPPQLRALEYIKTLSMSQRLQLSSERDYAIVKQQYALAVIYYSLNGPYWNNNHMWVSNNVVMSSDNVCDWYTSYSYPERICNDDGMLLVLDLSHNGIFSPNRFSLPTEIQHLTTLQDIDLSRNDINGQIPTEIGKLTNLQRLALYENKFTGTIPTEIAQLSNSLQTIELNSNKLYGTIPAQFIQLNNLITLLVNDNGQIVGNMPLCTNNNNNNNNPVLQHLWADCVNTHDKMTELICNTNCCRCCSKVYKNNCELHYHHHIDL